jgi:hypothetical protein
MKMCKGIKRHTHREGSVLLAAHRPQVSHVLLVAHLRGARLAGLQRIDPPAAARGGSRVHARVECFAVHPRLAPGTGMLASWLQG